MWESLIHHVRRHNRRQRWQPTTTVSCGEHPPSSLMTTSGPLLSSKNITFGPSMESTCGPRRRKRRCTTFWNRIPVLIPGLYDLHNGPVGNVVISKLKLSDEYVTDFAFISENSAICQITLVEIESPKMQIFRKSDGLFTAEFSRSLQQVRDWDQWCNQHTAHLKDTFRRIYHRTIFKYQRVIVRCILVAGRRSEVVRSPKREQRWAGVNRDSSLVVMTYDRLLDSMSLNPRLLHQLRCVPSSRVVMGPRSDS
jgi:hypothetical protein